jgi:MFS transporter, SHS family, lactate transporter
VSYSALTMLRDLKSLTPSARNAFIASFLGWTLDAFDFFILVFIVRAIAADFSVGITEVTFAILLTLAMRPVGAFLFGWLADRYGRRPIMMIDILLFSFFELAAAFAPNLTVLLILRALFGIAMGGEWGIGASLALESVPERLRGILSGMLQEGYAVGYLLAAVVYYFLFDLVGWRGMFAIGVVPALLVVYLRMNVEESPAWLANRAAATVRTPLFATFRKHWGLFVYLVLLMTAFNFLSHGTQDLYPTFLQEQLDFSTQTVGAIAIVYNVGAICGGVLFGALSERIGRRVAILVASLLVLPIIPLWAYGSGAVTLAVGAFLIQFMVQGAWGVVPVHLNELSPDDARGTFPGFAYQLGNLLAAVNATLQASIAEAYGNDYRFALAIVAGIVAVAVAGVAIAGREARGIAFGRGVAPAQQASPRRSAAAG